MLEFISSFRFTSPAYTSSKEFRTQYPAVSLASNKDVKLHLCCSGLLPTVLLSSASGSPLCLPDCWPGHLCFCHTSHLICLLLLSQTHSTTSHPYLPPVALATVTCSVVCDDCSLGASSKPSLRSCLHQQEFPTSL